MKINLIIIIKQWETVRGSVEIPVFGHRRCKAFHTPRPDNTKCFTLPKLDGDWANIDGLLFNPPDPIKIDDACCCWIADGGRISNADELVGTMLT